MARSIRAQGRARRRLLLRPRPGSSEEVTPPEAEAEAEAWGRARRSSLSLSRLNSGEIATCCQPYPGGWHSSRSGASGAIFLPDQSVKGAK
jgi:hypothetical protein